MSTWEARMSAKAKARIAKHAAEDRRARSEQERREEAEELARSQARQKAEYDAGPPCTDCYEWTKWIYGNWLWDHKNLDADACHHECHGPEGLTFGPPVAFG